MKLKRFVAKDMRSALSMIKEELGPDAVIMSNKRVSAGVEIVAGVEQQAKPAQPAAPGPSAGERNRYLRDDEVTLSASAKQPAPEQGPKGVGGSRAEGFARSLMEILERQNKLSAQDVSKIEQDVKSQRAAEGAPAPLGERSALREIFGEKGKSEQEAELRHGISSYARQGAAAGDDDLGALRSDIEEIKKLLRFELAGLIKETAAREEPVRAMAERLLASAGFDSETARELTAEISPDASFNLAWRELGGILERRISIGGDEIVKEGGVVALIGPAGVGKTTTLAKLAARFVMRYGAEKVALVTADHYRIGAAEQIRTYGRIMGCTAREVASIPDLPETLYELRDKSLVLVDTAGVGLSDDRFRPQIGELKSLDKLSLRHYLVLPATAQRGVLGEALRHFSEVGLSGLILTKLDESKNLGDALSLCIRERLRLSYVATGQRVPDDLEVPDAHQLAVRALSQVEDNAAQAALP
ncbi:MAG: flagellar biosynthesis protein FlhF [Succinivibrionaceae bacterium]|nr:flagellar biosynthesis protein FlhF [Succinivibrionaceae bacterium]